MQKMKCENYLCIYENRGLCLLDSVELDIQGQCKECIYVNISEKGLQYLKTQNKTNLTKRQYNKAKEKV